MPYKLLKKQHKSQKNRLNPPPPPQGMYEIMILKTTGSLLISEDDNYLKTYLIKHLAFIIVVNIATSLN